MSENGNGNGNGLASVEDLFTPMPRRYVEATLPTSNLRVRVRSLSEREISRYQASMVTTKGAPRIERVARANRKLIVLCLVTAAGDRLMKDSDAEKLEEWDGKDSSFLAEVCSRHTGITSGDVEDLVGNSSEINDASSASD